NFQAEEIEAASLRIGEDEELSKEREILVHAEELIQDLNQSYHELYESDDYPGICDRLNSVSSLVSRCAIYNPDLSEISKELEGICSQLKDVAGIIRENAEGVEADPQRLAAVEERLNLIINLKNKYGTSIEDILAYGDDLRSKLQKINTNQERVNTLIQEITKLEKEYQKTASQLSKSRQEIGSELEPLIVKELAELGMEKTQF